MFCTNNLTWVFRFTSTNFKVTIYFIFYNDYHGHGAGTNAFCSKRNIQLSAFFQLHFSFAKFVAH